MIFKRFALHRKKHELCDICEQEMLKSNFFSKKQKFSKRSFGIYIWALVVLFLLRNNLIHKVWIDLINERQHKTQGFLGKISESHGINLPENYNYLSPTELLDLCCSVVQFIPLDCGSIVDLLW